MRQLKISKQVTNRETVSLDKYLQEIGKVSLITAEEEVALAQKISQGDEVALHKLINANLRFVISVAKQYQNKGINLSDLINEGNLGLIKAAKRFDETRGFKFISYAVWWIRQSIMSAIADQSRVVRLPLNKIGDINRVRKAVSHLEQKLERQPSIGEVADFLDCSEGNVKSAMKNFGRQVSMDAPIRQDEETNLYDVLAVNKEDTPDKGLFKESLRKEIDRAISTLRPNEAEIVRLYYGLNGGASMTLEEIGEHLDLTRERIRQIKKKAIRKLKQNSRGKILKTYLG